jgi:serine/threonine protein phosphatase PrpC
MPQQPRLATESIAGQRPYQEDAVLTETLSDGRTLVAVADGMGGHAAGEVASALALETLVSSLERGESLERAFLLANERVHEKSREPGKQGMGTTLVAALIDGSEYAVGNVGDSRCYHISANGIRQLTEDHSFVTEAIKRGQSEEEARASQWRDALTRSIGIDDEVKVDVFGPFPIEPETALLLCSDGLYKTMSAQHIRQMYGLSGGPRGAAQSLVAQAYEDGSDDNISVAIAEFGEMPRERSGTMPIEFDAPSAAPVSGAAPPPAAQVPTHDVRAPGVPIGLIVGMVVTLLALMAFLLIR